MIVCERMKRIIMTVLLMAGIITTALAAPFIINSSTPFGTSFSTVCGVPCRGYVIYTKTAAAGWGWKEDTNALTHTASVATNAVITWLDRLGASGCGVGSVNIPVTANAVRFSVYWPTADGTPPAGLYPLTLDGFNP